LTRIVFDGFSAVPSDWWSATIFTSASEIGTVYSQNSDVPSSTFLSFAKSKGLPNGWTTE
jgi:hypothetical protein